MADLVSLVTEEDADVVTLSSNELEMWWLGVAGDTYPGRQGLQTFLDIVKQADVIEGEFSFRPSGWEVKLSRAAAQGVLTSAILGAVLAFVGADQLPAAVLAAVIPLLFDVEQVKLSAGERHLLARLREVPTAVGSTRTAEELFALLPEEVRAQTTFVDFLEFLEVCHKAGQADLNADNSAVIHTLADRRFRLSFR